jgi:hypothetical protein
MKSIPFNTEHREKFLSMVSDLFPFYAFLFNDTKKYFTVLNRTKGDIIDNIHWFEFLLTHVARKLNIKLPVLIQFYNAHWDERKNQIFPKLHPVDFVYNVWLSKQKETQATQE